MSNNKSFCQLFYMVSLIGILASCNNAVPVDGRTQNQKDNDPFYDHSKRETIFGEGGFNFFFDKKDSGNNGGILGVNSYLWRASLDTISFMPVNSADPFGGVIITDWYVPAKSPNERLKLNVYILGKSLRADGVRVSVFRQVLGSDRVWRDAIVPESTKIKIEDSILTRARQIRSQTVIDGKN